jgi:STE24 endopeptidase
MKTVVFALCFAGASFLLVPAVSASASQNGAGIVQQIASSQEATPAKIVAYTLPPDLYRKARNRGRLRFASELISNIYLLVIFWLILRLRLGPTFRNWAEKLSRFRFVQAAVFVPLLALTVGILQLPVALFDEWVLKLYRISVQAWPSWLQDWAMNQLIIMISATVLVYLLYVNIRTSSRRWWLYSWLMSLPLILFFTFVSPYFIDPLFNHYEPLAQKAPELIPGLQRISARAGQQIPPERMFWMLASDKTIETNALVEGIGSSKRIVIWDTSLAQESHDEILADFGHELGHYALQHVLKRLLFTTVVVLALLFLASTFIKPLIAQNRWGIRALDDWASLPALLLVISCFAFPASAISNTFTRFQENHADVYSLEVTHGIVPNSGQILAREFQKFGETVLMDPDPNPIEVFCFYQHPSVPDRIRLFATYDPWATGSTRFVH